MEPKNRRIWELDALRGIGILAVLLLHLLYDIEAFGFGQPFRNPVARFAMEWTGEFFVLLSGLCATLGKRTFRRGAVIFAWGMVITGVTAAGSALGALSADSVVRFGVLHLLGICMMLWPLCRRLNMAGLVGLGLLFVVTGYRFGELTVRTPWLFPIGLCAHGFTSADYFPLLPHLGWFFLGAALGRTFYENKETRLPRFPSDALPVRFLRWCGSHSLLLYLLHQPVLFGLLWLLS